MRTIPNTLRQSATVLSMCGAMALCAGCDQRGAAPNQAAPAAMDQPREVTLIEVVKAPLERTVEVTGSLFADEDITVAAKVAGRLELVSRDAGDEVRPDERLARLESRDFELALDERRAAARQALAELGLSEPPEDSFDPMTLPSVVGAQAEAKNARSRLDRGRELFEFDPPLISEQEYADLQTQYEVAEQRARTAALTAAADLAAARAAIASVATAEQRLSDATINAPRLDGRSGVVYRVAERLVAPGEYVTLGQPMFRLVAIDPIRYRARVPERYASCIEQGQPALVRLEGVGSRPGRDASGVVHRVWPTVDPASRTFVVEVLLANPDGALKPGAFAQGIITTGEVLDATFVPREAVFTFAGLSRVFSVADGKAVEHRVELGAERDGLVQIVSELDADRVIAGAVADLANGVPVRERAATPGDAVSGLPAAAP